MCCLNAQVERIEEYCKKNNFAIIEPTPKAFVFTESSTRGGRKKFKEMIEFIEKQKHKTAICVHTLDRLQRGFEECAKIKQLLKDDKIKVHFIQETLVLDKFSSDDDFTRYLEQKQDLQVKAEKFSDNLVGSPSVNSSFFEILIKKPSKRFLVLEVIN